MSYIAPAFASGPTNSPGDMPLSSSATEGGSTVFAVVLGVTVAIINQTQVSGDMSRSQRDIKQQMQAGQEHMQQKMSLMQQQMQAGEQHMQQQMALMQQQMALMQQQMQMAQQQMEQRLLSELQSIKDARGKRAAPRLRSSRGV